MPVENSEDMLKIDKKLVTKKIWSYDLFEPGKAENVSRVLVLVADLFTFQVPEVSIDVNNRNMVRNKVEISTCKHGSNGALYVCSSRYCFTFAPLIFSILGMSLFFGDSWTLFFLFFDIFLHLGAQKK